MHQKSCRARARDDGIFEQCYMCNPLGATTNHVVDWSAIERCRYDYEIIRVHLEHDQIIERFGRFPHRNAILGRAPRPNELAAGKAVPW